MRTGASSWKTTTALLRGLASVTVVVVSSGTVLALPSFGTRLPHGERVPCAATTSEAMAAGCSRQGYCLGLGHHQCNGVQPDDVILERTTEETRLVSLNPFGDDFKTANYEWYLLFFVVVLSGCVCNSDRLLCFLSFSYIYFSLFVSSSLFLLSHSLFYLLLGPVRCAYKIPIRMVQRMGKN